MRRPARPLLHRAPLVLIAALLLGGCSGGDESGDAEADDAGPSASSSAGSSASPSPTASDDPAEPSPSSTVAPEDRIVDPCALLDTPDYASLIVPGVIDSFAEQITQYGTFMTCRAYLAVITPLRFGFSLAPGAYDTAYAELAPRPEYADTLTELDLGDRAFVAERSGDGVSVYAEADGVTFMITHAVGSFGLDGVATGTAADVQAAATRMVETGAGAMSDEAVLLPDSCPSVSEPVVTDLIGTVAWGRGGSNPEGIAACGYAGEDGGQLRVSYTFLAPKAFDTEYAYPPTEGDVVVDPKPGVYKEWSRGPGGSYSYLAMYPDHEPQLELQLDFSGGPGPRQRVTKQFLAWANAYLRANEPGHG